MQYPRSQQASASCHIVAGREGKEQAPFKRSTCWEDFCLQASLPMGPLRAIANWLKPPRREGSEGMQHT